MGDLKAESKAPNSILVSQETDYGRKREEWWIEYNVATNSLYLSEYHKYQRDSKQYDWDVVKSWRRPQPDRPRVSSDVKIAAKRKFVALMRFE